MWNIRGRPLQPHKPLIAYEASKEGPTHPIPRKPPIAYEARARLVQPPDHPNDFVAGGSSEQARGIQPPKTPSDFVASGSSE